MGRKVLLLAGEESGAMYARGIAERLRAAEPAVEIRGYGDYGFDLHDMAVMGIVPVLLKLFYFLRLKKTMKRAIDDWRPDVVCTVDYPGMNLRLAAYARAKGIRTVHVVCPQVWAWKQGRIPKIEAALDRLCCFLPFEPRLFRGGFATFVGHPLAVAMAGAAAARNAPAKSARVVALLPGSRKGEIERILPTLLEAAVRLRADLGEGVRFVIPAANSRARRQIESILSTFGLQPSTFNLQDGGARELLGTADCAAVASGTATLEAALSRCPTILVYRMSAATWWCVKHLVKGTRYAGLANIIWERCRSDGRGEAPKANLAMQDPAQPMPELLQENLTADAVYGYLKGYLADPEARADAVRRLDAAMAYLGAEGDPLANVVRELI